MTGELLGFSMEEPAHRSEGQKIGAGSREPAPVFSKPVGFVRCFCGRASPAGPAEKGEKYGRRIQKCGLVFCNQMIFLRRAIFPLHLTVLDDRI